MKGRETRMIKNEGEWRIHMRMGRKGKDENLQMNKVFFLHNTSSNSIYSQDSRSSSGDKYIVARFLRKTP